MKTCSLSEKTQKTIYSQFEHKIKMTEHFKKEQKSVHLVQGCSHFSFYEHRFSDNFSWTSKIDLVLVAAQTLKEVNIQLSQASQKYSYAVSAVMFVFQNVCTYWTDLLQIYEGLHGKPPLLSVCLKQLSFYSALLSACYDGKSFPTALHFQPELHFVVSNDFSQSAQETKLLGLFVYCHFG